jgi:hypothetical protein
MTIRNHPKQVNMRVAGNPRFSGTQLLARSQAEGLECGYQWGRHQRLGLAAVAVEMPVVHGDVLTSWR